MNDNCYLCGTDKDSHYDGVQCPMFNGTYSATQKFTSDPHQRVAPSELDIRCNSCGKPMVFHTRFATWVCRLFTRIEGIAATYEAKPVWRRTAFIDRQGNELPISAAELYDMKQGPCHNVVDDTPIDVGRMRSWSPGEHIQLLTYRKPLSLKPCVLTAEVEHEMIRLLMDYREDHSECHDHTLGADDAKQGDRRCDLCKRFDAIPTDAINWMLRENQC